MYIRKTTKKGPKKEYVNYLLVESVSTPKGPRQKTVCSLGDLAPRPREEWLQLARKVEDALVGQERVEGLDAETEAIVAKARARQAPISDREIVAVQVDKVETEELRQAGPVHVGLSFYNRLGVDEELAECGLSGRARLLAKAMVINRLVHPGSEYAMPDWIDRTALADLLGPELREVHVDSLYRNLDRLYPHRQQIEQGLAEREKNLFDLDDTIYLYDLTSTYFEGQALANPAAQRGYSRDSRPDCKQVVVGLVVDREGFPKAHEVFDGNLQDRRSVDQMLTALEKRVGKPAGATVIVDRGMAYAENLDQIRRRGLHYLVAGLQPERNEWLEEFETDDEWENVVRLPSPRNPFQKKTRVEIKRRQKGDVVYILCRSEGRQEKDRAIRDTHEQRLLTDLTKLQQRVATGRLKQPDKIQQAIGRLLERYPRVARYYEIAYDTAHRTIVWHAHVAKKASAAKLDGSYILKTDRQDLTADEIWRTYILLTRVEDAFRDLKSPLMERPIFHHRQHRTQTHIFLCVLAYHLLAAIEHRFLQAGMHTSWWTLRQQLSTHQVVTVVLPTTDGRVLKIRKATVPEAIHREIYATLRIPAEVMTPVKTWHRQAI